MATQDLFSDDLLAEILYYFSFAILLQWKSVSKQFLRVISNPYFISNHPAYRKSSHHAFETDKSFIFFQFRSDSNSEKIRVLSLDSRKTHTLRGSDFLPHFLYEDFDSAQVRATQRDLVLCSTRSQDYTHYFVCNPFTKHYVALPPIRMSPEHEMARVGFIYDRSQSRFAVAHIPIKYFQFVESFQVDLFLSHTGEWGAFTVTTPDGKHLMRRTFDRNIHVSYGKFVWWLEYHGIFLCDPFHAGDSIWRIIPTWNPSPYYENIPVADNFFSLVLPKWPTVVPALKPAKLQD